MKFCPVPSTSCDLYSGTKFEVAMSSGLGGDAYTRKIRSLALYLDLGGSTVAQW